MVGTLIQSPLHVKFEAHRPNRAATRVDRASTHLPCANLSEPNLKLNELRQLPEPVSKFSRRGIRSL